METKTKLADLVVLLRERGLLSEGAAQALGASMGPDDCLGLPWMVVPDDPRTVLTAYGVIDARTAAQATLIRWAPAIVDCLDHLTRGRGGGLAAEARELLGMAGWPSLAAPGAPSAPERVEVPLPPVEGPSPVEARTEVPETSLEEPEREYTTTQFARRHGVVPGTVSTWARTGMPHRKVGRRILVKQSQYDRWLEEQPWRRRGV